MGLDSSIIVRVLMAERERLFSYIWMMVCDTHLAEDVFQDVSLLALEKGTEVADETHLRGWLRHAARFKALEALRQSKRTPLPLDESVIKQLEEHWARYDAVPESDQDDLLDLLKKCIRLLTPDSRKLLVMHYGKGLRSREIARQLKRKVEAVYQSITRAHRNLSDCVRQKLAAKRRRDD